MEKELENARKRSRKEKVKIGKEEKREKAKEK